MLNIFLLENVMKETTLDVETFVGIWHSASPC
jgi:hypothetical protein